MFEYVDYFSEFCSPFDNINLKLKLCQEYVKLQAKK